MRAAPLVAITAMAVSGAAVSGVESYVGFKAQQTASAEESASASLLGQFRTNTSAWLWLRTDLYLHNGVEMRQMTAAERLSNLPASTAAPGEELHDESAATTVVPPKERDFRGILGDIERSVSAYSPMSGHVHNTPRDAVPLFRLMTWIDPGFIQGWTVGSMAIAQDRNPAATELAFQFLREGLAANPTNVQILADLGRMSIMRKQDVPGAVPFLERAVAESGRSKAMAQPEQEALLMAYRLLSLCHRDLKGPEASAKTARMGLTYFRDDNVLLRLAQGVDPRKASTPVPAPQEEHHEHDGHDHDHEH